MAEVQELMTREEVAEKLRVTPGQVDRFRRKGDLICIRMSRKNILFAPEDVVRFVVSRRRGNGTGTKAKRLTRGQPRRSLGLDNGWPGLPREEEKRR